MPAFFVWKETVWPSNFASRISVWPSLTVPSLNSQGSETVTCLQGFYMWKTIFDASERSTLTVASNEGSTALRSIRARSTGRTGSYSACSAAVSSKEKVARMLSFSASATLKVLPSSLSAGVW